MKMQRKIFHFLLAIVLMISTVSITAFAQDYTSIDLDALASDISGTGWEYSAASNILELGSGTFALAGECHPQGRYGDHHRPEGRRQ